MDNSLNGSLIDGVFSKYSGRYTNAKAVDESDPSNSYMSFDSYLNLLVAQMSNQDFNNPMDDSEVLAQMAQYSMLEGIKNMTQQSSISYATSLVGKYVTINDDSGYITGKVDSISVSNGEPFLMINGQPYKSGKVTDIVSDDAYNKHKDLIGATVTFKAYGDDGKEVTVTHKVSDVVYVGGESFAVVKGKLVAVSDITAIAAPESENAASAEKTDEGSSDEEDGTVTEETTVTENTRATYSERSQSLIDSFMRELDEADAANTAAAEAAKENSVQASPAMFSMNSVSEVVETAEVSSPDYAAGVMAMNETFTDNAENIYAAGSDEFSRSYDERNITAYSLDDIGNVSLSSLNAGSNAAASSGVTRNGPPQGYGGKYGVNAADYSNTAITSRIKQGEVIAYTNDGQPVTEIGWSGLGRLGDVITLADGTQRVRVNLRSGRSVWFETTGRFTIDQLCDPGAAPGSFRGVLTAEESSIRHYSDIFDLDSNTARRMFPGLNI